MISGARTLAIAIIVLAVAQTAAGFIVGTNAGWRKCYYSDVSHEKVRLPLRSDSGRQIRFPEARARKLQVQSHHRLPGLEADLPLAVGVGGARDPREGHPALRRLLLLRGNAPARALRLQAHAHRVRVLGRVPGLRVEPGGPQRPKEQHAVRAADHLAVRPDDDDGNGRRASGGVDGAPGHGEAGQRDKEHSGLVRGLGQRRAGSGELAGEGLGRCHGGQQNGHLLASGVLDSLWDRLGVPGGRNSEEMMLYRKYIEFSLIGH